MNEFFSLYNQIINKVTYKEIATNTKKKVIARIEQLKDVTDQFSANNKLQNIQDADDHNRDASSIIGAVAGEITGLMGVGLLSHIMTSPGEVLMLAILGVQFAVYTGALLGLRASNMLTNRRLTNLHAQITNSK